eukprot:TRINITY_DN164_c2_g1_i1.p1 TRINITY_DN164_c2_g1~~TRINITY_DN164_c2_g1_i1.p1  ORF type:complete len:680 (-),score=190.28 TRINITY_DN164_c2_g1_i1:255-2294(-)
MADLLPQLGKHDPDKGLPPLNKKPSDDYEKDTDDVRNYTEARLMDLILPDSKFPLTLDKFSFSVSKSMFKAWVKQPSPCCAAAVVAGAWNANLKISHDHPDAMNHKNVLDEYRDMVQTTIDKTNGRLERLFQNDIKPLLDCIFKTIEENGGKAKGQGIKRKMFNEAIKQIIAEPPNDSVKMILSSVKPFTNDDANNPETRYSENEAAGGENGEDSDDDDNMGDDDDGDDDELKKEIDEDSSIHSLPITTEIKQKIPAKIRVTPLKSPTSVGSPSMALSPNSKTPLPDMISSASSSNLSPSSRGPMTLAPINRRTSMSNNSKNLKKNGVATSPMSRPPAKSSSKTKTNNKTVGVKSPVAMGMTSRSMAGRVNSGHNNNNDNNSDNNSNNNNNKGTTRSSTTTTNNNNNNNNSNSDSATEKKKSTDVEELDFAILQTVGRAQAFSVTCSKPKGKRRKKGKHNVPTLRTARLKPNPGFFGTGPTSTAKKVNIQRTIGVSSSRTDTEDEKDEIDNIDENTNTKAEWNWKAELWTLIHRLDGVGKLTRERPSTGIIGNMHIIDVFKRISDGKDVTMIAKPLLGRGRAQPGFKIMSSADDESVIASQWDYLRNMFLKDGCSIIIHHKNHYSLLFAVREWVTEDGPVKQILTARKGQRPKVWIDWSEMRATLLSWTGYKIISVQKK